MAIDFGNLKPAERMVWAIDTSDRARAIQLMEIAKEAGASVVKLGLELSTAKGIGGWEGLSIMAKKLDLDWIADAKLDDIPNTVKGAAKNIATLDHSPIGITMHTTAGPEATESAQKAVGDNVTMFGVTVLTSLSDEDSAEIFGLKPGFEVQKLARLAARTGIRGLVASGLELPMIKANPDTAKLITLIPGTRSEWAPSNDQSRVITPEQAIISGADLLVMGRQVTGAENPRDAFERTMEEIIIGLEKLTRNQQ